MVVQFLQKKKEDLSCTGVLGGGWETLCSLDRKCTPPAVTNSLHSHTVVRWAL